jgi:hypothetical protein
LPYDFIYPSSDSCSIEGVDYSNSKVFETAHPIGRGEIKQNYSFPNAIAVQVYFDSKCKTPSHIVTVTSGYPHRSFTKSYGTLFEIYGNPNRSTPMTLLGDNVNVH